MYGKVECAFEKGRSATAWSVSVLDKFSRDNSVLDAVAQRCDSEANSTCVKREMFSCGEYLLGLGLRAGRLCVEPSRLQAGRLR